MQQACTKAALRDWHRGSEKPWMKYASTTYGLQRNIELAERNTMNRNKCSKYSRNRQYVMKSMQDVGQGDKTHRQLTSCETWKDVQRVRWDKENQKWIRNCQLKKKWRMMLVSRCIQTLIANLRAAKSKTEPIKWDTMKQKWTTHLRRQYMATAWYLRGLLAPLWIQHPVKTHHLQNKYTHR